MLSWIVLALCGLVAYFVYDFIRINAYWKNKGVPAPLLFPIVGRFLEQSQLGQGKFDCKWTAKLGRMFGLFVGPTPLLIITDREALKRVLVKDFGHFVNRRELAGINGPVLDQAVSALKDQHWKDVRGVLVPTFTSGKLRLMHPLIQECCQTMVHHMDKMADEGTEFEAEEVFGGVTMDVLASAFFGTKIDSQMDHNNEFVDNAKKAFMYLYMNVANPIFMVAFLFPKLIPFFAKLGYQGLNKGIVDFFIKNTEEIIKLRTASGDTSRKDFLQQMLNSMKGHSGTIKTAVKETETMVRNDTDAEQADIVSDAVSNGSASPEQNDTSNYKLTTEELVAQSIIFLLAGYDTIATTFTFMTYCLTVHPDIQDRLRDEIEKVMGDEEAATYELLAKMEYLDCCINETLRMYPAVARVERVCNKQWTYNGLTVEEGTIIGIPIYAVQHDPEYWPDPETFDPERFSHENKQNIKPYSFQAFGQGPRNCIGIRFAYYEIKLAMVSLLRKYRLIPCSRTEIPLQITDTGFLKAKNGVWVKLQKL